MVTGQARYDGARPLTSPKLVTWFRGPDGAVSGVFFSYPVTGSWVPGRIVDFTVETMDETLSGHPVRVAGEGHIGPR